VLEPGLDADRVANRLEEAGVIADARLFAAYLRLQGADESLRAGTVMVGTDLTPAQVMRRIAVGFGPVAVRFTVPEGLNRFEIARRFERFGLGTEQDFLAATTDPLLLERLAVPASSLEGYLFPDTYEIADDADIEETVSRMVEDFRRRVDPVFEENAASMDALTDELGWTPHEVVVLASIVEEEAAIAAERPIIAGVFLNRLRSDSFLPRHRLQADPTVSYGCTAAPETAPSCSGFDGTITRAMLEDRENPYNTYRHPGLPPGPVSNPGADAVRAVLVPEAHDYLYFVARGRRRHAFSATLDDHNRAVRRYRGR